MNGAHLLIAIDGAQKGQLGHGDLLQRNVPTIVEGLKNVKIIGGKSNISLCNSVASSSPLNIYIIYMASV